VKFTQKTFKGLAQMLRLKEIVSEK